MTTAAALRRLLAASRARTAALEDYSMWWKGSEEVREAGYELYQAEEEAERVLKEGHAP